MTEEEKELKEEIARKEKQLADFVRLGAFIDLSEEEKEKRIDLYLDDINKLKKKSKTNRVPLNWGT